MSSETLELHCGDVLFLSPEDDSHNLSEDQNMSNLSRHNSVNTSFFKGELNQTSDTIDFQKISDESLSNDLSDIYEKECKDIEQELDQEFNEIENESRMKQKMKEEFLKSESNSRDSNDANESEIGESVEIKQEYEPKSQSAESQPDLPQYKYLFKNTRYFLIKSINHENIEIAKLKNFWSTPRVNEAKLNKAYRESDNVLLIFSVSESGRFQGVARLASECIYDSNESVGWVLPPNLSTKSLTGLFKLEWITREELVFHKTSHLLNPWNENKPVKIGRDGQEFEVKCGEALCRLFPVDKNVNLDNIVEKLKKHADSMKIESRSPPCVITAPLQASDSVSNDKYNRNRNNYPSRAPNNNNNYYQAYGDPVYNYQHESDYYHSRNYNTSASSRTPKNRPVYEDSKSNGARTTSTSQSSNQLLDSKKNRRRSNSPQRNEKRRRSPSRVIHVPKEVVLNGSYQDYQLFVASSNVQPCNSYASQHQYMPGSYYNYQGERIPYSHHLSHPGMMHQQYNASYDRMNPYGASNPSQMAAGPYAKVPSSTQSQYNNYEQEVEEFLKHASNYQSRSAKTGLKERRRSRSRSKSANHRRANLSRRSRDRSTSRSSRSSSKSGEKHHSARSVNK